MKKVEAKEFSKDSLEALELVDTESFSVSYSHEEGIEAFKQALASNRSCAELCLFLSNPAVPIETCVVVGTKLSQSLMHNSYLKKLTLSNNNVGYEVISELSSALRTNCTLAELDLSFNNIDDRCGYSLSDSLVENTSLTSLNLSDNKVTDMGASSFVEVLENHNDTLKTLRLENNKNVSNGIMNQIDLATRSDNKTVFSNATSTSSYLASLNCLWR
mmetsp:Transcript_16904/g.20480  ORF Transcript_16904/g.20480 Transcript_16904/m.20480 type:complete len:217 (+) Transcript_16904:352-1002(+)